MLFVIPGIDHQWGLVSDIGEIFIPKTYLGKVNPKGLNADKIFPCQHQCGQLSSFYAFRIVVCESSSM